MTRQIAFTQAAAQRLVVAAALLALSLPCIASIEAQTPASPPAVTVRPEVISGRVSNNQNVSLTGAVVMATMAPDRVVFIDTVDAAGNFSLHIGKGTGDYLVYIASSGYTAFRKRVLRVSTDSMFRVDAQLIPAVTQLATVQVAARKATPIRLPSGAAEATAAERMPDALVGAFSPDLAGDLNALTALVPGMTLTNGGYSALGLGAGQNSITLNGSQFAGTSLPRDTRTNTRVTTSTYDPARGWFSGSNVNVELVGGGLFATSRAHVTLDAPALQSNDRATASAGQQFTNVRLSYGADGPVTWENKYFYNVGVQADRRSSPLASLTSANSELQQRAGLSADSTAAFMRALSTSHIPAVGQSPYTSRVIDNISLLARLERTPMNMKTFTPQTTTFGVLVLGQQASDKATGISSFSTPTRGIATTQQSGMVQGTLSHYFGKDYLNETRTSLSWSNRRETSALRMPEGRVVVQSALQNGTGGFNTLLFGGNSAGSRNSRLFTWETINTTKFFANGMETHGIKLTGDIRYDGYHNAFGTNASGTYTFASLADVAANSPSSYSRSLNEPIRVGGAVNAFLAISDNWRPTRGFQMMYGARLEGNAFTARPAHNDALRAALGANTEYAPASLHVSPRIGFTWTRTIVPTAAKIGPAGQYALPSPRYLRGGIGEFRNMLSPSLLADPMALSGLSTGSARLLCIGESTPTPDWDGYAGDPALIPTTCSQTSLPQQADIGRNVRLIAPGYRPPTSWRGNLAYASRNLRLDWSVEGVYSLNLHQPGSYDLNLAAEPAFQLADDARPVFVPASAIVPNSGLVSSTPARISPNFARVVSSRSDLRSVSRQLTLNVRPAPSFMRNWYTSGAYTYGNTRAQARGFDGSTFGAPNAIEWARGDFDVRHQFISQFGYSKRGVTLAGFARLQSGLPYTPMIASDVNGDGLANDRAFVSNLAGSRDNADALLAYQMGQMLAGTSGAARSCLLSQLGKAASRNSCTGPWSMSMNAQLSFAGRALKARRISSIAINISNPLAAIDQLAHGRDNARGWGSMNTPDANLLMVRGFDAGAKRFQYDVNPRFGQSQQSSVTARAPFRVTLDIAMDLGVPVARQQLNQWLRPGRAGKAGPKLAQADLKKRYERNVPDPFDLVLKNSDSLLVNRAQVEALQAAQKGYRAQLDTVWNALASELATLGDSFDDGAALKRQELAMDRAWEVTRLAVHHDVVPVLTRVQMGLLPGWVATLYRATQPTHYRMYMP
ncbi:MAG: carboxypeptidase regulatory-like domain-containing protein [Phycisphaerae bacterium]|nr:carboxypeptidase regulatory-like domain-containing protein [Gemmatimonadaceae bacterium]